MIFEFEKCPHITSLMKNAILLKKTTSHNKFLLVIKLDFLYFLIKLKGDKFDKR